MALLDRGRKWGVTRLVLRCLTRIDIAASTALGRPVLESGLCRHIFDIILLLHLVADMSCRIWRAPEEPELRGCLCGDRVVTSGHGY